MDKSLFSSMPMNKKHKVDSFDMIGMSDPVNGKPDKAMKWLRALHHETRVYPEETYFEDDSRPPICIFVPETALMNKMLEATAKNSHNMELLLSKFNCLDMPKPQWLQDQEQAIRLEKDREKKILKSQGSYEASFTTESDSDSDLPAIEETKDD